MSRISKSVALSLVLADFANTDSSGNTNVLGMFKDHLDYDPATFLTSRFSLIAEISVPPELSQAEFQIELSLLHNSGDVVKIFDPVVGEPVPVAQISQTVFGDKEPDNPVEPLRNPELPLRHTLVIDFPEGLPISPGGTYCWRLLIDGDTETARLLRFAVS
jgi:hypothetical protein